MIRHLTTAIGVSFACATAAMAEPPPAYLFTYFVGNGEDGLHLAWSRDGLKWQTAKDGRSFLTPQVGESKLMRDPCVCQGPDGTFHMVWTTAWAGKTIGYASTRDFITWSAQQAVPVMAGEPDAKNCWAPEIIWDGGERCFRIFWATTIPGRFKETDTKAEGGNNHRIYATTTTDFKSYTPTRLFLDPGFNVIDATLVETGDTWRMIVKDETREPVARKNLRLTRAPSPAGPFPTPAAPFSRDWVEGPTALKVGDEWIVYFDCYTKHHYGALRTRDWQTWEDLTNRLELPKGIRHGTAIRVPEAVLEKLLEK